MVRVDHLTFIRAFKGKKKKKKRLSDAEKREKWKNPTPRDRRRRKYWKNLQTAAREAARVASAPRGTVESKVAVQPNVYHPTFMLWVPTAAPMGTMGLTTTMPASFNPHMNVSSPPSAFSARP